YLPSGYTPEKRWPILYAFDPLARGRVPVERFSEAAEKYGWIIAGSNNSRNGPLRPSLAAVAGLLDDTQKRLSVDARRIYTTGFSGGARVAVRVGYLCGNCVAGVIACGAGFPVDITPSVPVPFALFGMVGTNDFNFPELKRLDGALDKLGAAHRVETFDGAHTWAPKELCAAAVEWMELQAMRAGTRGRDAALVETLWTKGLGRARAFEDGKRPLDAYRVYAALAADFAGLRDVAEAEGKAARLKSTKEVRAAAGEEEEEIRRQQRIAGDLESHLAMRGDADNGAVAAASFRHAVAELRRKSGGAKDTGERRVARRTLNQMFARYYEAAMNLRQRQGKPGLIAANLEVAAEIAPDNPHILYELACAYSLNGERKKAIAALRRAVEKGFADVAEIIGNKALDPLRGEAGYRELIDGLNKKQP
ncbi:MAG: TPR end-of-group domain-containing protein, partial [Pyrinomonadaceae bacterium]